MMTMAVFFARLLLSKFAGTGTLLIWSGSRITCAAP